MYLTSAAKPLLDDIRHLIDVTWGEAFTGIPKQKSELVMELLDTVRSNFIDLDPLPATTASLSPPRRWNCGCGKELKSA